MAKLADTALFAVSPEERNAVLSDKYYIPAAQITIDPADHQAFAPLTGNAREELKSSIAEKGIVEPLIIDRDGTLHRQVRLWDGRNRLEIALELGIERVPVCHPRRDLSAEEKIDLMWDKNYRRRQMDSEQRRRALVWRYGEEAFRQDGRGGDRRRESQEQIVAPVPGAEPGAAASPPPRQANLARKIARETGIPAGTAAGDVAAIRRQLLNAPNLTPATRPATPKLDMRRINGLLNALQKEAEKEPQRVGEVLSALNTLIEKLNQLAVAN